jgi:2-oxoglutaroyl-CoA hydrolase
MRSRRIAGRVAYNWGTATDCVADAKLEKATDDLVEELRGFSPPAQRRRAIRSALPARIKNDDF